MMNKPLYYIFSLFILSACGSSTENESSTANIPAADNTLEAYADVKLIDENDYLLPVYQSEFHERGEPMGFVNRDGDTIIPIGKYQMCWTDTLKSFAIVYDEVNTNKKIVAIDKDENVLFDVVMYDNFPDQLSDGLFRVKRNDKYGYANEIGQIIIPCQYACAYPFEEGKAKVALKCEERREDGDEHKTLVSDAWYFIDVNGNKLPAGN